MHLALAHGHAQCIAELSIAAHRAHDIRVFRMSKFPWDTIETFPHPNTGALLPEWAVSTVGTTKVEMSMNDARIWRELPREQWLAVMLSNRNNAKTDRTGGMQRILTVLFGFGKPADPAGNLMLVRVHFDIIRMASNLRGPDSEHFKQAMILIEQTFKELGIKPDSNFYDEVHRN